MTRVNEVNKILVVAPSWVGDMVMAEALLQQLRHRYPLAKIDVLVPPYLQSLLLRFSQVNHIWLSPLAHGEFNLTARRALAQSLQKQNYDQAIILPNSWKSALVPWLARIPKRTGWRGEMRYGLLNDLRKLDVKKLPLMVQRFVALALDHNESLSDPLPHPRLYTNSHFLKQTLHELNLLSELSLSKSQSPILALCIGAEYGSAKRWPATYFAKVAQQKAREGWIVLLLGGEKDKALAAEVQLGCNNICLDLTGKTTLAQVVDVLSLAKVVITNDSGLMHIAAALQLPLIAIYGSSSPNFTPPLSVKARILSSSMPCSPCFKRQCPLGHLKCMVELKPDMVIQTLSELEEEHP